MARVLIIINSLSLSPVSHFPLGVWLQQHGHINAITTLPSEEEHFKVCY